MTATSMSSLSPLDVLRLYPPHRETLSSLLASRVQALPAKSFIESGGVPLTYADFADRVARTASLFAARGIGRGDRVGIMTRNHPILPISFFALARLGAIMVPVNPDFGVEEAGYILRHAGVAGVLCAPQALATARAACAGIAPAPWFVLTAPGAAGEDVFDDLLPTDASSAPPEVAAAGDATVLLIYTSGTTGFPKGVMHSQRSGVLTGEAFIERIGLVPEDRLLCILPMFHMNALFYSVCGALAAGATLIIAEGFSASTFWQTVASTGATQVNTIAAISTILTDRPRSEYVPGHVLRKMYGAPFSPRVYEVFQGEFGVPDVIEGYGMSEIPGVLGNPMQGERRIGSMGIPALHPDRRRRFSEVRIIDDAGNDVAPGDVGELIVRTPIIMQGYYKDPAQTAAAFRDGWFCTGDLGRRDADGYYWFVARKKDIIRRRGENIAGAELDRVIGEHPDVAEAAAIAVPSQLGEDDILVAVVLKAGARPDAAAIVEWCRARLAAIKQPRYIAFVAELPYTPTHRVAKYRLRDDPAILRNAIDVGASGRARPAT